MTVVAMVIMMLMVEANFYGEFTKCKGLFHMFLYMNAIFLSSL